jgi:hypothetical protein
MATSPGAGREAGVFLVLASALLTVSNAVGVLAKLHPMPPLLPNFLKNI